MKLNPELKGARLTIADAAGLAGMHPTHLRRLCRRGVFPRPKRTLKGRPYFDYEILEIIADVLKTGIGQNGEEVCFYRRAHKSRRALTSARKPATVSDEYIRNLADGLRQLGISRSELTSAKLGAHLEAVFGANRPELAVAMRAIVQRLVV